MHIPVQNRSPHPLPAYQSAGAAGLDLTAWLEAPVTLQPLERRAFPTGIYIALPPGYEAQVRPRSGMALKRGLTVLNSPGTVDSDYRGEIQVVLVNLSAEPQTLTDGDRIAQLVIARHEIIFWQPATLLPETERSGKGFGSTGLSSQS